MDGEVVQFAQF